MRWIGCATWRTARVIHTAGEHRCDERRRGAGAGQIQGAAFHTAAGWSVEPSSRSAWPTSCGRDRNERAPTGFEAAPASRLSTVDERNPWLGLASFTEETRAYFYGREEEVAELARRVQRKLLTVLFGQSGLGKTSILRAGLGAAPAHARAIAPSTCASTTASGAPEPKEDQIRRQPFKMARRVGSLDPERVGGRGRVAVGVSASPRRRAAR
jgi:hypothetical protein